MLVILQMTKILSLAQESPLLRQQGAERGEAYRARKRTRQEDSQGPEAMAARRPVVRALGVLREREERQELKLGRTRMASKGGASQSQQGPTRTRGTTHR